MVMMMRVYADAYCVIIFEWVVEEARGKGWGRKWVKSGKSFPPMAQLPAVESLKVFVGCQTLHFELTRDAVTREMKTQGCFIRQ